jgi:Caspase domain
MVQRALLVGIDQYPDPRNDLNSCVADTLAFREILMTAYGVSLGDIQLLHNQDATLDNVRKGLDSLLNGVRDGEKVVYFESSHGYRYPEGNTMADVLCLYDAFLEDSELVDRSKAVPGDCLTVVTDACFSGGLSKLFFAPTGTGVARAKVWQPPEDQAATYVGLLRQVSAFKFFGRAATSEVGAVANEFSENSITNKAFVPATKDLGAGQLELNGLLFAACTADQTAAAGSPSTNNLSAFTYGLQQELNVGGGSVAVKTLCDRVGARLASLNMSQTPVVIAPLAHQGELDETLITMAAAAGNAAAGNAAAGNGFGSFLQSIGIGTGT